MKIFLIYSKYHHDDIKPIADRLINEFAHEIIYPNPYNALFTDLNYTHSSIEHRRWKIDQLSENIKRISQCDSILVLNISTPHRIEGYIGGTTMLAMYEGFRQGKEIFIYNELPNCPYIDELNGLTTSVIYQDLNLIRNNN